MLFFIFRIVTKLKSGQILFSRTAEGLICITLYEVIKATTNTCELREIRKNIISQSYDEQEVVPEPGAYISKPIRCKVTSAGAVEIKRDFYAWPWDGKSQWQAVIIFIP